MEARGPYRIRDAWVGLTTQYDVRVLYSDGRESEIPEDQYRAHDYRPQSESLPWKQVGTADARRSRAVRLLARHRRDG